MQTGATYRIEIPDKVEMSLCNQLAEIQKKVWGFQDIDVLPAWKLFVTPQIGGVLIVAYDGDQPIAFGFFTRAVEQISKEPYLYLDMLAVAGISEPKIR